MTPRFAIADGAHRVRLDEAEWAALWVARIAPHAWAEALPRALHPLPGTAPGELPEDPVCAAAVVALGATVGVQVLSARHPVGLLASQGLVSGSAASVVRPVRGGASALTVGRGVEISAYDASHVVRELRRLLPRDTHASAHAPEDHEFTMPAELAAVASRALREGDETAAREACAMAGLDDVPPLMRELVRAGRETASLSFRGPDGLRLHRLLATSAGWVEIVPTTTGTTHRLLDHDQLTAAWAGALADAVRAAAPGRAAS